MVFNRALLLALQSYMPRYLFMHDCWALQVCAALGGTIIYDEKSYIRYRQHQGNVIGSGDKMKLKGLPLLRYRIKKLFDYSYSPRLTAAELEEGYGKQMSKENRKIAAQLAKSDTVCRAECQILSAAVDAEKITEEPMYEYRTLSYGAAAASARRTNQICTGSCGGTGGTWPPCVCAVCGRDPIPACTTADPET
jgi:hypothetical protein